MANWLTRRRAERALSAPLALPALEPARREGLSPLDPSLPPLKPKFVGPSTRVTHRALLALEGGDEPTARELLWALFHTDLRQTI